MLHSYVILLPFVFCSHSIKFPTFQFMVFIFYLQIHIHLSSFSWPTNHNATRTATPRIATLTCNIHTCITMVSKSECTTLTPIVQVATNLRFNTQISTLLLKIWMPLVSQRPILLQNLKYKSKVITILRLYARKRLWPDLTRQCSSEITSQHTLLYYIGLTLAASLYALKGRS